ncbi:fused MFS/spermidine synthase [Ideonella sp.]|uniref:fused MFS/spermidine synthase n=1 Tax=Ideonella sp. TaxID=1929293 RepID=UPI0035B02394
MPETFDPADYVKPFVYETLTSKALHFSISAIQSRMKLRDPYALDLEYTRTMMGFLLFHPAPRQIVMIGLGGGSLAKFCHHHLPKASIQVAEINPHVIALRDEFHVPADDERFRVIRTDGAQFVRHRVTRPDVLMVDGFDTDGQPSRLCSQRFYDDCHEMLQPDGILVVNLHYGHRMRDAYVERIRRSFDDAVLVVDDGDLSNSIVFACKGHALDQARASKAARPTSLDPAACDQLADAFAMIKQQWKAGQPA